MERLGSYQLSAALTNENAGYSLWGFGTKNGREYFIKQFVEQKYPANDTVSSPERLQKKLDACEKFEKKKTELYKVLNENSDGNAVRIEEFFRIESKYYISMRKIDAVNMSVSDIAKLPVEEIRRLCAIIAHGVASLHKGNLIHADLKPDNILFMKTLSGSLTAKIIDFDSGFLESAPPGPGETIVGDFHYFSPEACRCIWGEELELTCKMDIFALGVLFHQYFTGELPGFDTEQSDYSGEAAAKGDVLTVSEDLPSEIRDLIAGMLCREPDERPSAYDVFSVLSRTRKKVSCPTKPEAVCDTICESAEAEPVVSETPSQTAKDPFYRPGDL